MQAKWISERELVKKSMTELCTKAGFADCHNLVQRDLEFICDSIESKTGILISLSTIKRLLNGQFSRLPQVATLNAIAMFLGYQNWQHFKISKGSVVGDTDKEMPARKSWFGHPVISYLRLLVTVVLVGTGLFFMVKARKHPPGFEKASFSVDRTTNNELPNTAVFHYNVDDVNADSFFIQQSWDKNRRVKISPKEHELTDIYYEPGYHIAKLIANDRVIRAYPVSIPTDRWFFYAKEKVPRPIPQYIHSAGSRNGFLSMNEDEIVNSHVDIQKENNYFQVYFPSVFPGNSDNYILKCRLRTRQVRPDPCLYFICEVFCQNNFMFFTSASKGCASEINAQYGENYLSGKIHDLSALGTDVTAWQDVEVNVKDRKVTIRINNADVFRSEYHQPAGLITGLGFISNGLCDVDFVSLKTQDGKDIYVNDFGQ